MVTFQKQFDSKYQVDGLLIDQLLTSVDIPDIQMSLEDRMPEKAQEAIHRIANRLRDKPKTAGATSTEMTMYVIDDDTTQEMYSLNKKLWDEAKRSYKAYRKPSTIFPYQKPSTGTSRSRYQKPKQLRSSKMRGVKSCFVCK